MKLVLFSDAKGTPKAIPDPNLLKGWEKQLDHKTNRYFYINHNSGTTQWEPPAGLGKLYKTFENLIWTNLENLGVENLVTVY